MIRLLLSCGGCDATAISDGLLTTEFISFSGRGHGFGVWKLRDPEEIAPPGWVLFDPYTACTYCPDCAADLGLVEREAAAS